MSKPNQITLYSTPLPKVLHTTQNMKGEHNTLLRFPRFFSEFWKWNIAGGQSLNVMISSRKSMQCLILSRMSYSTGWNHWNPLEMGEDEKDVFGKTNIISNRLSPILSF